MTCANTASRRLAQPPAAPVAEASPSVRRRPDPTALLTLVARYRNNGLGLEYAARRLGVTTERLRRAISQAHVLALQGVA